MYAEITRLRGELERTWSEWSSAVIGHDCNGDQLTRWHPEELPLACQLPNLRLLTTHRPKPDEVYDHAQRAFSCVLHHQRWLGIFKELVPAQHGRQRHPPPRLACLHHVYNA